MKLVKTFPDMARAVRSLVVPQPKRGSSTLWNLPKNLNVLGPRIPLDVAITNQRAYSVRSIPTDVADPVGRIQAIAESSAAAKALMGSIKTSIRTDFPSFGAPWLISGRVSMYGRSQRADRLPPVPASARHSPRKTPPRKAVARH